MKEKILAAIKAKFPNVNLSKKRLDAIAAKIESKTTDENEIDAKLDEYNDYNPLADLAKEDDRVRNLEAKAKAQPAPKDKPKDDDEPAPDPLADPEMPKWAKAMYKQNQEFATKIAGFEGKEKGATIKAKLDVLLKEIPASYGWEKRALPATDEEVEAFVTTVTEDYAAFSKEMTDKGIAMIPKPGGGGGGQQKQEAVSPEIKAFAEKAKATEAAAAAKAT